MTVLSEVEEEEEEEEEEGCAGICSRGQEGAQRESGALRGCAELWRCCEPESES
jgi:hypothetical protein